MIPFYLLDREADKYPVYCDNSTMKISSKKEQKEQSRKHTIEKVVVTFVPSLGESRVRQTTSSFNPMQGNVPEMDFAQSRAASNSIGLGRPVPPFENVSLLTTADRLSKEVFDRFKLNRAERSKYMLRFRGINSYLTGDVQLIYFEEVRDHLMKDDSAESL